MKKLEKIAAEKGRPLDRIIPPLVNRMGVVKAAKALNVAGSTISKWLEDNGYVASTTWGKRTTPQEMRDIEAAHARINEVRVLAGQPPIEDEVESW